MPEIRNVSVQQMDQRCPACGNGYMRPTGIVLPIANPQYEHACQSCGHKETYGVRYPHIITTS